MAEVQHPRAAIFGEVAASYDAGRPGYPEAAIDFAIDRAGLGERSTVLEVGAGTGQLSRSLVERVGRLVLVEPAAGMRAVLRARVPQAEVLDGSAEALTAADGSVEAVCAAQSFHWFDQATALGEFRRVLAPGGAVVLLWNVREDANPLDRAVSAVIGPLRGDVPSYSDVDWARRLHSDGAFRHVASAAFAHQQLLDAAAFADRFASVSWVASLPERTRAGVARELMEAFDAHQDDGEARLTYRTEVHVALAD